MTDTASTELTHGSIGTAKVLELVDVDASYGNVQVLREINIDVEEGQVVVVLGANGAGKTTTLRAICNMVRTHGSIRLFGEDITKKDTAVIVRRGVAHVPQGRGTFPELSVEDNLMCGAYIRKDTAEIKRDIDRWFSVYPVLGERRKQSAGSLSGGEQQMLAVARALMSRPRLMLLDEPSLGLAPLIVQSLFETFGEINRTEGTTMLIVEQNANLALGIAQKGYVLEAGHIVLAGSADELRNDPAVREAYLGT